MKYYLANVLDTERTCYPDGVFPAGESQEIIEFGITVVDLAAREIVGSHSIAVVPAFSRISPYCTELTGWTLDELMARGVDFKQACARIVDEFDGLNRLVVVDSDSDLPAVQRHCLMAGVAMPFGTAVQNVSTIFSLLTDRRKNVGNQKLLRLLGVEPEPVRHRADSDSRGTARAFLKLLEKAGFQAR